MVDESNPVISRFTNKIKELINNKADKTNATQSNAGLMSAEDKTKLDTIDTQYSINVEKQSTADTGFFSTYVIKQNNTQKGVKINIPKDFLVKSATVKTCTIANQPVQGYAVGDKYIDLVINSKDSTDNDEHLYLATKEIGAYPVDEITLTVANGKLTVKDNGITWAKLATAVQNTINGKEVTSNKVTSISASSTNTQYPSAKCVYDNFCQKNDPRLSDARTPISHTDSNGAYGKATTSVWGHTKLNSATNSTDETTAATPKAVKAAYDLANGKITNGTGTVTSTNIADKTIVNGDIADNAAISYSKLSGVVSSTDSRLSNARTPIFNHIDASSSAAKDLNNYKTGGFYYTNNNANDVPYVANRPDSRNFAFFLLVETWGTSSAYVKQTLTYYDTGVIYTRTCNNNTWSAWSALIREGDSRLTNARTPIAHASTATTYGASSASNYGHSMASSTSPKAPGTANVGSETAKFARGDHVHPLQSSTTTTLSLVNTAAMSGTVKCTESNGWGVVYFEGLKCTNTTTEYTPFATLPHTSKVRIYANFNLDATGTNAIFLRVDNNQLQGKVMTANQRMYGSIVYPIT